MFSALLAKYTTKSVAEFGIAARRISTAAIAELDIPAHTRRILSTLAKLATLPGNTAMLAWLHTLGYRGHITTKSRRYSITMTALRAARHHWRTLAMTNRNTWRTNAIPTTSARRVKQRVELSDWRIDGAGHNNDGERLLVHTAALRATRVPILGPFGLWPEQRGKSMNRISLRRCLLIRNLPVYNRIEIVASLPKAIRAVLHY